MRVGCATCHTAFDVEDEDQVHRDGPHVCSPCRTMGSIEVAVSVTTTVEEAAPAMTRERRMQLDFDDTSPGGFERDPLPERSSQPPAPVSLEDLAMILAPGVEPPRISSPASGEAPEGWVALSPPVPSSRPERVPRAASSDDLGSDDLAAMATYAPAPARSAPISAPARADSIPAPRDSSVQDLELMAALCPVPAPSSRRRAADLSPIPDRPSRSPIPSSPRSRPRSSRPQLDSHPPERARVETTTYDDPSASDSRMTDLRTMTEMYDPSASDSRMTDIRTMTENYPREQVDEPPPLVPAVPAPAALTGEDLIGMSGMMKLSGDLFRGEALAPLITPDLSMRTAPTESLPPTPATVTPAAPIAPKVRRPPSGPRPAVAPVTTKQQAMAAPSGRRSGLMLGLAAVCVAGYFLATRAADAPPAVEVGEAATVEDAVAEPAVAAPAEEPSLDDAPAAANSAAAMASASSAPTLPAAAAARVPPLPVAQPAVTAKALPVKPTAAPPIATARPVVTAAPPPTPTAAPSAAPPPPTSAPAPAAPPAASGSQFDKSITDNPY